MNLKRVYFDYNIYDGLAKDRIHLPENYSQHFKIYVSVAHAEEFFNAADKNNSEENREHIEKLWNLLTHDLNNSGVLNPSLTRIIDKPEKFVDALQRVREYDTRQSIKQDAEKIHESQNTSVTSLLTQDKSSMDNSNLSSKDIWKRPEVIEAVGKCREVIDLRNREATTALMKDYGWYIADLIAKQSKLEPFELKQNIFKYERPNFYKLEFLMEFLQDVLNSCNYNRDKTIRTVNSGVYDTEHAIYASYCHYFVTNDAKLTKRLNAIYYFLGLETECLSFDQWCDKIEEETL